MDFSLEAVVNIWVGKKHNIADRWVTGLETVHYNVLLLSV